jgi:hypothetical protein
LGAKGDEMSDRVRGGGHTAQQANTHICHPCMQERKRWKGREQRVFIGK